MPILKKQDAMSPIGTWKLILPIIQVTFKCYLFLVEPLDENPILANTLIAAFQKTC